MDKCVAPVHREILNWNRAA